jgi:uncharacterized membrane protein
MRPASITRFDQLYLGALALGIVNTVLAYDATMTQLEADPDVAAAGMAGPGVIIGAFAFGFAISLLLWFFISRRASGIAKWVLVVFTVIGTLMLPLSLTAVPLVQLIVTLVITAMQIGAVWYLFRPDARAWFAHGPGGMDPAAFE